MKKTNKNNKEHKRLVLEVMYLHNIVFNFAKESTRIFECTLPTAHGYNANIIVKLCSELLNLTSTCERLNKFRIFLRMNEFLQYRGESLEEKEYLNFIYDVKRIITNIYQICEGEESNVVFGYGLDYIDGLYDSINGLNLENLNYIFSSFEDFFLSFLPDFDRKTFRLKSRIIKKSKF